MVNQDIKLLNANLKEETIEVVIEAEIEVVMMEIENAIIVENLDIWLKTVDFLIKEKKVVVVIEAATEAASSKFLLNLKNKKMI